MLEPETVKSYIETSLECEFVAVEGDGQHFEAIIVAAAFRGQNRVRQHQTVYKALGDRMRAEIHALSMKTYTPEEWRQRGSEV
ncbi:MAG: BolA family protein [Burkholderiales bacterium]|nr:BolA family transcriptional regulator [Burkholderiales bacterium]MDQ3195705.1 BolA family transcriptional regulator [Pseudomonadota bacterium]